MSDSPKREPQIEEEFDFELGKSRNLLGFNPQPNGLPIITDESAIFMDFETLENFMKIALEAYGVPKKDAQIVSDVLIDADKHGIDSHGIGRLKLIYCDRIKAGILNPETEIEIVKETPTTAVIDGHNGMGHVVSQYAVDMAIEKAKQYGLGMVVCRNSTHFGNCGYYCRRMIDSGMIGMVTTNARPSIAPTFSVEPMLGTNPLTFCAPSDEEFPWILDCGTSIVQRGKIEMYGRADKDLPSGLVIGTDGEYRTDTKQILKDLPLKKAACCPIGGMGELTGGYKGYGFATFVEIMSSCLQAGNQMHDLTGVDEKGNKIPIELGHSFLCINPEFFLGLDTCKAGVADITRKLRAAEKVPGCDKIFTHGEKEYLANKERMAAGGIMIPTGLQKAMTQLRDEKNLEFKFDWDQ
eukprot:TRINITY_DN2537_c0_g1_i1.p1 TRINITY_DN2537_c0_g1~~TRINITY_DN2537_c0_g1_i1.p1  ORF type:complete len:418 (-),score=130.12 TRINITY_DN2537_c0_g1_i1:56-1285(-)